MAFEENYVPDPGGNVPPGDCFGSPIRNGHGAPTCEGFQGAVYIDVDSGDLYEYESGSWVLQASGGGGGATEVYAADYSGVAPVFVPAGSVAIATDTVTGTTWYYYGSAWH